MNEVYENAVVYVVDDDPVFCRFLTTVLASVSLSAEIYNNGQEFLTHYNNEKTACLLLDMRLPGSSGLEIQKALNEKGYNIPIIFMTGFGDVNSSVEALKEGALDFLLKPVSEQKLLDAVFHALNLDLDQRKQQRKRDVILARFNLLSHREREVLSLVVEGKANKWIAAELGISQKTVEAHRAQVMKKMRAQTLAELIKTTINYRLFNTQS